MKNAKNSYDAGLPLFLQGLFIYKILIMDTLTKIQILLIFLTIIAGTGFIVASIIDVVDLKKDYTEASKNFLNGLIMLALSLLLVFL